MKALVTGGSGFIGSRLIPHLCEQGWSVRALVRKTSRIDHLTSVCKFETVIGDLSDEASLREAVRGVDVIFHLAAVLTGNNSDDYFRSNEKGTASLMRAVTEVNPGLRRFVFVSSLAAGGPLGEPGIRDEAMADAPVSFYGQSKLAAERGLAPYFDRVPTAIVRPPIVYGPGDRMTLLLAQMALKKIVPVVTPGSPDGQKHHSIVYVDDLVEALARIGAAEPSAIASGSHFYIRGPEDLTFREIMNGYGEAVGVKPYFLGVPVFLITAIANFLGWLGRLRGRTFSLNDDKIKELLPDYWLCSDERLRKATGFVPRVKFSDGVRTTVAWYRKERWI